MPRSTKENKEEEKKKTATRKKEKVIDEPVKSKKVKVASKEESKVSSSKTKASRTKTTTKTSTTSKSKTTKTTNSPKNTKTKKTASTKANKATSSKTKKTTSTRKTTSTKAKKALAEVVTNLEYYDLPYRYNKTMVKILAQTPNTLFIYWDISDEDRDNFQKEYGENFFSITKPILIIHNITKNYSFDVEINDFANSWYLNISDTDCKYNIELGRKFIQNANSEHSGKINSDTYIYLSSSNELVSPNDHILFFDNDNTTVKFKNVKNNTYYLKKIKDIPSIYKLYKELYYNEILEDLPFNKFTNPSSGFLIK